jgi:hypothetical protein
MQYNKQFIRRRLSLTGRHGCVQIILFPLSKKGSIKRGCQQEAQ